jgi:hypothetical protein
MIDGAKRRPLLHIFEVLMKYLCLVYLSREHWDACPDAECFAYAQEVAASGKMIAAEPLHAIDTATTVRVRNGQMSMTDGPFAETKEMLAGFYLIDAKDLNDAIAVASKIPPAKHGSIEVRPVRDLDVANYRSVTPDLATSA